MTDHDQTTERYGWPELGQQLRVDSIRAAAAAGSGHPTSAMSAADLMAVLPAKYLRYDFAHPAEPTNDRLILSKGHASPLPYSMYKAAGAMQQTRPESSSPSKTTTAEGGIGEAVLEVFADTASRPRIVTLAVRNMPSSGTPAELLAQAGIDRDQIVKTVLDLLRPATSGVLMAGHH